MSWSQIDKVLMVGGMTRMPMVRDMISSLSNAPTADEVSPDEAVSLGAAIQAILLVLGEEDNSGKHTLPAETRQQFSNRDGSLIKVSNITSHTLGVVLWDDTRMEEYVFPMIAKMTPIPCELKNSFGTATANMKSVVVRVVEGESSLPSECTPLGTAAFELPPYLPKGSPVELTYRYNASQILEVVVDGFGKQKVIEIQRNMGLSEEEIAQATANMSLIRVE